jgi:hypothetical protein
MVQLISVAPDNAILVVVGGTPELVLYRFDRLMLERPLLSLGIYCRPWLPFVL